MDDPKLNKWLKAGGLVAFLLLLSRFSLARFNALMGILIMLAPFIQKYFTSDEDSPNPASARMTREDACKVLSVSAMASEEEIKAAHKRMMQRNHPDTGGSEYLASQINQARDILLGK